MIERQLELAGEQDFGPCDCCGGLSRSVWGYIHRGEATEAAYFVQWTLGQVSLHGAHFDLVLGPWGERATSAMRQAVSLEFRNTEQGPAFMVIDSSSRPVAGSDLVGTALSRSEVVGTPLASQVFDLVDTIWIQDGRIAEIRAAQQADAADEVRDG